MVSEEFQLVGPICNDFFIKLGKALVFTRDALEKSNQLRKIHGSTSEWAPDSKKIKGHTCHNASKSSKLCKSFNESLDFDKHDVKYKKPYLPLVEDIAELACQRRDLFPMEQLAGATVDIVSAYNQTPQTS
jgi:hypothetical protein